MNYSNNIVSQSSINSNSSGSFIYCGLLLFFVFEYFNPSSFLPFLRALHLNSIIPLSVFVLCLVSPKSGKVSFPQNRIIIALLIMVILSLMYALLTFHAYQRFKQFFGYFLVYYVIVHSVNDVKRFNGTIWTLIIIHALLIALNPDFITGTSRVQALTSGYFLGDGNDFALSLNIIVPLAIFLHSCEDKTYRKWLLRGLTILFITVIVITESRASSIAFSAMLLYMWLRARSKILGIILLACLAMGILVFGSQSYFDRMSSTVHYQEDTSALARLDAWEAGVKMAFDHPITGVGAGNFNSIYGRYYRPVDAVYARWLSPHSMYIQCMAELGFTGLILLILLFIYNFRVTHSLRQKFLSDPSEHRFNSLPTCLEMSLIGFGINAGFLGVLYYPHLFVITGLFVAADSIFLRNDEING